MASKIPEPKTVILKKGETLLLHTNGKLVAKETYNEPFVVYTAYDSFVGTEEEVDAKIEQLKLVLPEKVIPKFEIPKPKTETK